jgi:G3E family GTPase
VPPFERLIIETTGLADPAPIVATLTPRRLSVCLGLLPRGRRQVAMIEFE